MYWNDACFSICTSKIRRIRLIYILEIDHVFFPPLRVIIWNQCYAHNFSGHWKTWWLVCIWLSRYIATVAWNRACSCLAELNVIWQGEWYPLTSHRITLFFLELVTCQYDMIQITSWQMLRSDLSVSFMKTCIHHEFQRPWRTPANALRIAIKIRPCRTHQSPCDISLRFLGDLYLFI